MSELRKLAMGRTLAAKLATIPQGLVAVIDGGDPEQPGEAPIRIRFKDGTELAAAYWRLITGGQARWSSFDDRQKYGLPAPVDTRALLRKELADHPCRAVRLDRVTGDLVLDCGEGLGLQVFNFTGYEIWHLVFADGTEQYSNFALAAD